MGNILYGWKAIQEHLKLSKAKILKLGYPVRSREWESPRVCADTDLLDEHTALLVQRATPYTPKRCEKEE